MNPMNPLYSPNDINFLFKYDISKLDYNLASEIYQFYTDLIKAEENRLYIERNKNDTNQGTQYICWIKYEEMKALIISSNNKLPDIGSRLKDIYKNEAA